MSQTSDKALSIERLGVFWGGRAAVDGVDMTVRAGEITALLGPNGAGKTSLVQAVAGIAGTCQGRLALDGEQLPLGRPLTARRAGLAVVPEGHRVLGDMSVADNLRVATAVLPRRSRAGAVDRALKTFPELAGLSGRQANLLSGGEQQMLALAQALTSNPRYIVVDELSLGLAPRIVERLARQLKTLADEGLGVLLIEQFTGLALSLAAQVYVLSRGRITARCEPQILSDNPDLLHSAYLAGAA